MAATPPSSASGILGDEAGPPAVVSLAALRSLKEGLSELPHDEKSSLVHAERINPDLVDDEHLMGFLEAEGFDVGLAMARLLRYWKNRYKVFGPEKFALPMTLDGAMKDDIPALKAGFVKLLPVLDEAGRTIIYRNNETRCIHTTEEKIRVWWYLVHVADSLSRKKGFVLLVNGRSRGVDSFDPKLALAVLMSGHRYFPIRWQAAHIVHGTTSFPSVVNAVKAILSPAQRETFILHNGSDERVAESLSSCFLPKHCIPSEIGGSLHISTEAFVRKRLEIERVTIDVDGGISCSSFSTAAEDVLVNDISNEHGCEIDLEAKPIVPISCASTQMPERMVRDLATKPTPSQKKQAGTKPKKVRSARRTGQRGDPRMNRAMQARLDNPDLSLVAALMVGGFVFPDVAAPDGKISETQDVDGVTLYQRRNQLLRRLRLEKKKAGK